MIIESVRASFMVPPGVQERPDDAIRYSRSAGRFAGNALGHACQSGKSRRSPATAAALVHLDAADPVIGQVLAAAAVGDVHRRAVGLDADPLEAVQLRREPVVAVDVAAPAVARDRLDHAAAEPPDAEVLGVGDVEVAAPADGEPLRLVEAGARGGGVGE